MYILLISNNDRSILPINLKMNENIYGIGLKE